MITVGTKVRVDGRYGVRFFGTVTMLHVNRDNTYNGVARVKITDTGSAWYRCGDLIDVGTMTLTELEAT